MNIYPTKHIRYKQFTTYTNICLQTFLRDLKKKVLEGCGNSSKVTQVRAEINILVYTKPPGENVLTISQKEFLFVLLYIIKGGETTVSSV